MAAKTKKTLHKRDASDYSNEQPVLFKRERDKINSLGRGLQLEAALYHDETMMRLAAVSDQINYVG
jgi:hypothetical protein